jgi:Uma2 family endonuclease
MAIRDIREQPVYTGLTYEDYLELPRIYQPYEIIDGDLFMSPAPTDKHQWALSNLNDYVKEYVRTNKLGAVFFAPMDLFISRGPKLRTRQPDLLFFGVERIGGVDQNAFLEARANDIAPDMVAEVLSPEEERKVLSGKLGDYAAFGITEVWIVSPQAQTIETLTLTDGQYKRAGLFGTGDMVSSNVLPGFTMPLDVIFE